MGRFHHHVMYSAFKAHKSLKGKKTVKSSVFFALLGSACVKDAHKMLVKLTWGGGNKIEDRNKLSLDGGGVCIHKYLP